MQFSKLIISILILLLLGCQEKEVNPFSTAQLIDENPILVSSDSLHLNPNEGLVYYRGEPFTGVSQSFFDNGNKANRIEYVRGKKHGLYQKWFEDGLLSFASRYRDGKQNGLTQTWWKNGQLRSESNYEKGVPHGLQQQWYSSGAKFKKINLAYGKEQGLQQSWRENGKIYNNYEARNGRVFGLKRANLCYELDDEIVQYNSN